VIVAPQPFNTGVICVRPQQTIVDVVKGSRLLLTSDQAHDIYVPTKGCKVRGCGRWASGQVSATQLPHSPLPNTWGRKSQAVTCGATSFPEGFPRFLRVSCCIMGGAHTDRLQSSVLKPQMRILVYTAITHRQVLSVSEEQDTQ
jgi:hypothetical protein